MSARRPPLVDRAEELNRARELLRASRRGMDIEYAVWEYSGQGGIGKSELLRTISAECKKQAITSTRVSFRKLEAHDLDRWMSTFASEAIHNVSVSRRMRSGSRLPEIGRTILNVIASGDSGGRATADLIVSSLLSYLREVTTSGPLVLLFDDLDAAPIEYLSFLGEHLLKPLLHSKRVGISYTTRSRPNWGSTAYSMRRETCAVVLKRFWLVDTSAQLAETSLYGLATEIHSLTMGHPAGNAALIEVLGQQSIEAPQSSGEDVLGARRPELISALVEKVLLQREVVPRSMLKAFSACSVLRCFDVDMPLEYLLYIDESIDWGNPLAVIELTSKMIQGTQHVIELHRFHGGYLIDDFVRQTLSSHLLYNSPIDYLKLTHAAINYYEARLVTSPGEVWLILEGVFHFVDLLKLSESGGILAELIPRLIEKFTHDVHTSLQIAPLAAQRDSRLLMRSPSHDERRSRLRDLSRMLSADSELNEKLDRIIGISARAAIGQALIQVELSLDHQMAESR